MRHLFLPALLAAALTSCTTATNLTAGPQNREQLLQSQLPVFHRAVYWGKLDEAMEFVDPAIRSSFISRQQSTRRAENLVEMNVDKVEFAEDSKSATVDVIVRYFRKPQYLVKERREQETWAFSRADGWQYRGAEVVIEDQTGDSTLRRGTNF